MSKEILIPEQEPFISLKSKSYSNGKYEAELCLHFVAKNDNDIEYVVKLNYDFKGTEVDGETDATETALDISVMAELEAITEEQNTKVENFQADWFMRFSSFYKEGALVFSISEKEIRYSNFGKNQKWLNKHLPYIPKATAMPIIVVSDLLCIPTFNYSLGYDEDKDEFDNNIFR